MRARPRPIYPLSGSFLNETGNDPSPVASLPNRLPLRSGIRTPTKTAILAPSRQTPPFRTTATIFPCVGIENDVLGKDQIQNQKFCLEDDGLAAKPRAS